MMNHHAENFQCFKESFCSFLIWRYWKHKFSACKANPASSSKGWPPLALRTLAIRDTCHADSCHLGQLPFGTVAIRDTCHSTHLPFRTVAIRDSCPSDTCHSFHNLSFHHFHAKNVELVSKLNYIFFLRLLFLLSERWRVNMWIFEKNVWNIANYV